MKNIMRVFNIVMIICIIGLSTGLYIIGADWKFVLLVVTPVLLMRLYKANIETSTSKKEEEKDFRQTVEEDIRDHTEYNKKLPNENDEL